VCSENVALFLRWRVVNPNTSGITVDWSILEGGEAGTLIVPSQSEVYFTSARVPGSGNTARLSVSGKQVATSASTYERCVVPTPTPRPAQLYKLSGSLKGPEGRRLTAALINDLDALPTGSARIVATNLRKESTIATLSGRYSYEMELPEGTYTIKLISKYLKVISIPVTYKLTVKRKTGGVHFSVRILNSKRRSE
jgi:hypothetical protein